MGWDYVTKIPAPSDVVVSQDFGRVVAIDNDFLAVASPGMSTTYIYNIRNHIIGVSSATPTATLSGPSGSNPASYAMNDNISINENHIAIGDESSGDDGNGRVYIYKLDATTQTWGTNPQVLDSSTNGLPPSVGTSFYKFGHSVSLSDDVLIVGSPGYNNNQGVISSYYLDKTSESNNFVIGKVINKLGTKNFGDSVSIDGDYVMVGTSSPPGEVIFYRHTTNGFLSSINDPVAPENSSGNYTEPSASFNGQIGVAGFPDFDTGDGLVQIIKQNNLNFINQAGLSVSAVGSSFGFSTSYNSDYIAVGAPGVSNNTGEIYLYNNTANDTSSDKSPTPVTISGLTSEKNPGSELGKSVAVSNNYLAAGAPGEDTYGVVYFYLLTE